MHPFPAVEASVAIEVAELRLDGSPLACSTAVEAVVVEIGGDLRRARLARTQSIEDISRATKINSSLIRAIESDAFDRLPGGLFTRGFLRAYAREVGLDPDEIVARYRAEFEPTVASETADAAQPHDEPAAPSDPPSTSTGTPRARGISRSFSSASSSSSSPCISPCRGSRSRRSRLT
jgi:transcriptional regulator with XRE-family HTH domain